MPSACCGPSTATSSRPNASTHNWPPKNRCINACGLKSCAAKIQQQAATLEAAGKNTTPRCRPGRQGSLGRPQQYQRRRPRGATGTLLFWPGLQEEPFRWLYQCPAELRLYRLPAPRRRGPSSPPDCTPTIGIHHKNEANAMRLVDDLIEPFRPNVDLLVWQLKNHHEPEITPDTKRGTGPGPCMTICRPMNGLTPAMTCIQRLATSLAQVYLGGKRAARAAIARPALVHGGQSRARLTVNAQWISSDVGHRHVRSAGHVKNRAQGGNGFPKHPAGPWL